MSASVGVRLVSVIPGSVDREEAAYRELARIVAAFEGFAGVTFTLHVVGHPDPEHLGPGAIDIGIVAEGDFGGEDVLDDVLDVLTGPPRSWVLEAVDPTRFTGIDDTHTVEIVRRIEQTALPAGFGTAGYARTPGRSLAEPGLWAMWAFAGTDTSWRDVFSALLAHEAPTHLEVALTPSALTPSERDALEEFVDTFGATLPREGILRSSFDAWQRFLFTRPLFEMHIRVKSSEPLPPSLVSTLGWSISPPPSRRQADGRLVGGYETVYRTTQDTDVPLGGLSRLRHLFDPWEAACAFRLPLVGEGTIRGVHEASVPVLDASWDEVEQEGTFVGVTVSGERPLRVHLSEHQRLRHMYIVGQTGTGKSTLIANMALQDVAAGAGLCVIDPHGDLVTDLLQRIPQERYDDVIIVDPADPEAVVGVNLLEAESELAANFIVSELCEMFYELFDPYRTGIVGPRFESWLRNAANLLIANKQHPTSFLDISTLFVNDKIKQYLLNHVTDPYVTEFWRGEMARTSDWHRSEVLGWFRSKFEPFRASTVRRIVGQGRSTISFSEIMDESKILLVNLSKGLLGEYNSRLIGFVVLTRLWSAALLRGSQPARRRRPFYVYVDEFHSVVTPSLPDMLSEARKFGLGVTLANQFFTQVPEDVRASLLGNVGTRIAFRLGPQDAIGLQPWFGSGVTAEHLRTLPEFHAIAALSNRGVPLDPIVISTESMPPGDPSAPEEIRLQSNARWARPVDEIEEELRTRWSDVLSEEKPPRSPGPRSSVLPDWLDEAGFPKLFGDADRETDDDDTDSEQTAGDGSRSGAMAPSSDPDEVEPSGDDAESEESSDKDDD